MTYPINMAISSLSTGSVQSVLKTVGFRSLKLITTPTDTPGETFLFEINGVQVFIKGANLVPIDSFTPLITNGKTFSPHFSPLNLLLSLLSPPTPTLLSPYQAMQNTWLSLPPHFPLPLPSSPSSLPRSYRADTG